MKPIGTGPGSSTGLAVPATVLEPVLVLALTLTASYAARAGTPVDPRLRELSYDPSRVVVVPVKRGNVTLIVLDADEAIAEIGSGVGADCTRADATWCVAAQPGGRTLFVKPKSSAGEANNLAVVTNRRIHNFRFELLPDRDPRPPVYRLLVRAPATPPTIPPATPPTVPLLAPSPTELPALQALVPITAMPTPPSPQQLVAGRLLAKAQVRNSRYALADAPGSDDILPTLVFDDGRFTYLRFPGNREVPAVFQVLDDGSEALVNVRMEDELLVVDRVCRRLMLRAGSAAVGLWNEGFDLDGVPPQEATTVPGVRRALREPGSLAPQSLHRGETP